MQKAFKNGFLGFFAIPFFILTLFFTTQTALAACEPSDQDALNACIDQCDPGDQACIDSCCFDWPDCECQEADACTPQDQDALNACTDSCDPGDQGCIDSCCFDWPDCECPEPDACTPQDQDDLNACIDSCDPGDQGCIDSCCYDWPDCECQEADACTPQDQGDLDSCIDQCDPGDQACIDSCCYDWPDCECQEADACTPQDQGDLDSCIDQCPPGDQSCIDSCCYDWPDCECQELSCVDELAQCHFSCTDAACFKACDQDFAECSSCNSYFHCLNDFCAPNDDACKQSCTDTYPECVQEDPPEEYGSCYDDCFQFYTNPADIVSCIENCQEDYPDPDREPPYKLKEPRCFEETTFFDYEDVPSDAWFWAPINFLTRLEIPEGHGTGINKATFHSRIVRGYNRDDEDDSKLKPGKLKDIFLPLRDLNRFEASKIAVLVSCYTIPDTQADIQKAKTFSDLAADSNEYMNRVVYRATEVNLLGGYNDGTVKPLQPITRAEFLKLFLTVGAFNVHNQTYATSGFTDVTDPNDWYYPYIAFAKQNSVPIIDGYPDGSFRPNDPIKRNEAMKVITNTMFALDWISK